jgi:hypothetical protein
MNIEPVVRAHQFPSRPTHDHLRKQLIPVSNSFKFPIILELRRFPLEAPKVD